MIGANVLQPLRNDLNRQPLSREDVLHFRTGTVPVTVDVTPQRRRTPMGDLVLRGYIDGKEIEVVFPGRRQAAAVPLLQRLMAKLQLAKLQSGADEKSAERTDVRQQVRVDGTWRVRLMNEQDARPERRFQLVAARWRYRGPDGVEHVHGALPSL